MSASDMDMDGMEIEEEPDRGNDEGLRLLNPSPPAQQMNPDEFRDYFFLAYSSRFVNSIYVLLAIFGAQLLLQLFLQVDSSSFTQSLTEVLALNGYLSKQDAALSSRSLISISEQQLFLIQMILPLLVVVIAALVCSSSALFIARTHNWVVGGIGISMQLAIGFTPHLAQAAELLGWESIPSNCSISEAALAMRCDATLSTTPTCSAAAPISNDLFIELILRRAAFHAGQSLLHYALVALFIPDLLHAAVVMVIIAALNCARAQYLWKQAFCINLLAATLPSHVTSIAVALAACHQQRQLVRRQLLLQKQLQVAKDIRIEQLQCEKERLDFDRKAALQRVSPMRQRVTPMRQSEHAADGDGGRSCISVAETTSSCEIAELLADDGRGNKSPFSFGGDRFYVGRPSCDLREISSREISSLSPSSPRSPERDAASRLYHLLPQYSFEANDKNVVWFRTSASREPYRLHASHGLLLGADGNPLGGGACGAAEADYLFVISSEGDLLAARRPPFASASAESTPSLASGSPGTAPVLVTAPSLASGSTKEEPPTLALHHSSLFAGAAVAAAGEMTVKNGALLSISNWSGHYAPRPSCLRVLLDKLEEMGVSGLGDVQVQACGAPPRRTEQKRAMEGSFGSPSRAASDAGCSTVASSVYDPAQAMKTDD